jgi:hypothetical protein
MGSLLLIEPVDVVRGLGKDGGCGISVTIEAPGENTTENAVADQRSARIALY